MIEVIVHTAAESVVSYGGKRKTYFGVPEEVRKLVNRLGRQGRDGEAHNALRPYTLTAEQMEAIEK